MKAENLRIDKINESILKALKMYENSMIVIECSANDGNFRNLEQPLIDNNQHTRVIFVILKSVESLSSKTNELEHSWSHLTAISQQNLLNVKTNFQGFDVKLSQVLIPKSEALIHVDLNELFRDGLMKIGKKLEFDEVKVYIPRKFLKWNAKWNHENKDYRPEPLGFDENFFKNC